MAKTKMRILIDTHIFLWILGGRKLKPKVKEFFEDTDQYAIWVSHVVAWEIAIKFGIGKLQLPEPPDIFVPDRVRRAGFHYLPIELQHVLNVHNLPPIHRDPFDRLLVSQAKIENLTVLTADSHFGRYGVKTLTLDDIS